MSQASSGRFTRLLKGTAQLAVGFGIMGFLVWKNWTGIRDQLREQPIHWGYLVGTLVFCLAATLMTFLRWYLLVVAQRLPFQVWDSLRIGFIGYFFNLFIPGAVGGDLVKAVLLAREQQRRIVAITTVLIDRVVGMFGLFVLSGLAVVVFWPAVRVSAELTTLAWWSGGLLAIGALGMAVLFSQAFHRSRLAGWSSGLPVVGGVFAELFVAMAAYRANPRVVVVCLLMSVVSHSGFVLSLRCAMLAITEEPPSAQVHFMIAPLGLMVGALPVSPGGIGLAETAMVGLFDLVGTSGALALLMMLLYRGVQILIALFGLVYYLASRRETKAALAAEYTTGSKSDANPMAIECDPN